MSTRGHSLKLKKKRCNTIPRQHFFSERTVNRWNMLESNTVLATSIYSFESQLNREISIRIKDGSVQRLASVDPMAIRQLSRTDDRKIAGGRTW